MSSKWETVIRNNFEVVGTSGSEFLCRCPWHEDGHKPNLYINADRGVYLCHSCGQKGHLRRLEGALPASSTDDVRKRISDLLTPQGSMRTYPETWLAQFDFEHEAWRERGFSTKVIKKFNLGYDIVTDCLTIPMRSRNGTVLGVIRRKLDDSKPKYLYPKGMKIGEIMYGLNFVSSSHKRVAIVEGSMDCISCWDANIPAVALLGSRLTIEQSQLLIKHGVKHVVLMLDNDKAGKGWPEHSIGSDGFERRAAGLWQVHDQLLGSGIIVSVGWYRPYWSEKDPDELSTARRKKLFHSSLPWPRFTDRYYGEDE